jgi:Glycosyl transferase family 2
VLYGWPWGVPTTHSLKLDGAVPRISVVTANYNGGRYIEATLRSIICQGYPNLQYIVVDGASTDDSMAIIERYRDHIDHIICEPDEGHPDALNKGFAKADGEILAWLNSDDMYLPWTLQTVAEVFAAFPSVRWIEGLPGYWDDVGRLYGVYSGRPFNQYDYLIGQYEWIQQESTFWRRDLWEQAGGSLNKSYRLMPDGELWSRFFLHARLHRVDCTLGAFRWHRTNLSADGAAAQQAMNRAIEAMRAAARADVRARAARYQRAETLVAKVPMQSLRNYLVRWLTGLDFDAMGHEVITRDRDRWKLVQRPFR